MARPGTSICIPAYRSAAFIGTALDSARNQTAQDIEILVSVDDGTADPDTVAVCAAAAAEDPRIRVFVQDRQLNWTGNVNFLFDQVGTETYSILFHDDFYSPDYIAQLRVALEAAPGAMLLNSDLAWHGHPDDPEEPRICRDIAGTRLERVLDFFGTDDYVAATRGLSRRAVLEQGARFVHRPFNGFAGDAVYRIRLLALGDALTVSAPLYNKWFLPGSITKKWKKWPPERLRTGYLGLAEEIAAEIDRMQADLSLSADEARLMRVGARLYTLEKTRRTEVRDPELEPVSHDSGALALPVADLSAAMAGMPAPVQAGMRRRLANILTLEGQWARRREEFEIAVRRFEAAIAEDPGHAPAHSGLAVARMRTGDAAGARQAAELALAADPAVPGLEGLKRRFGLT